MFEARVLSIKDMNNNPTVLKLDIMGDGSLITIGIDLTAMISPKTRQYQRK